MYIYDFPDSSAGKEPICNAGDSSSISELGRSAEERIGYPLHYSWTSLVAQLVKNPPTMHETSARTWCTGKTQRDRVEREVGGGDQAGEYM